MHGGALPFSFRFFLLIGSSFAGVASAGLNRWTTNGPVGGAFTAFAFEGNSSTVYAGSRGGGVIKSVDGGGTWISTSVGLTNPYVNALASDPSRPGTLYAGTSGTGIFMTTNGYSRLKSAFESSRETN